MADDETKGILLSIKEMVTPKENPLQTTVDNLKSEVDKRDVQIKELTAQVESLKADKVALDNLRAAEAQKQKDAEWVQVKNLHQAGLFHAEKEAVERKAYEENPAQWLMAHVGNLATVKPAPAQGYSAIGNLADDKPIDMIAERGEYDPINHVFKGRV